MAQHELTPTVVTLEQLLEELLAAHGALRVVLAELVALRGELGEMRETLERYRPLLDKAEARMSGGPLAKLGRGAPRVDKNR